jgi:hypothetical protein
VLARAGATRRSAAAASELDLRALLPVVALYWLGVAAIDFINDWLLVGAVGPRPPAAAIAGNMLVWWGTWIVLTPAVLLASRSILRRRVRWWRTAAVHLCAGIVLGGLHFAAVAWVFSRAGGGPAGGQLRGFVAHYTLAQLLTYTGLIAAVHVAHLWRAARFEAVRSSGLAQRVAHLERLATGARIDALRRELDTHLLLNALASVSALVRERDGAEAQRLLAGLGEMIRAAAGDAAAPEVPLRQELALLRRYLGVARARPEVRLQVDDDVLDARVPPLLLQPLVENAIVHSQAVAGPTIDIRARRAGRRLWLEVRDHGAPPAGARPERTGLGNTRARLALLHGDAAEVRLETLSDGARAVVVLPLVGAGDAGA